MANGKRTPKTKNRHIVILTSHAMKGDAERGKKAGGDDYITKPINTREFPKRWLGFYQKLKRRTQQGTKYYTSFSVEKEI